MLLAQGSLTCRVCRQRFANVHLLDDQGAWRAARGHAALQPVAPAPLSARALVVLMGGFAFMFAALMALADGLERATPAWPLYVEMGLLSAASFLAWALVVRDVAQAEVHMV